MPALKDGGGNMAVFMKDKKALVQKLAFPNPQKNLIVSPVTFFESANIKRTEELVAQALMI